MNILKTTGAFRKQLFHNPPAYFHPGYFWFINDELDIKKMSASLRDMAARGAKSVCLHPCPPEWSASIPSAMYPPYLSDSYFKRIRRLVEECRKLGMTYWLYDEGGFPSGSACGQVHAKNPDAFARQNIVMTKNGPQIEKVQYTPQTRAPYPNLLTPGVTQAFIELTHERHKKHVGNFFGNTIRFAFMDEPVAPRTGPGRLTWTDDLGAIFKQRKGYSIEPFFSGLLKKPSDKEPSALTKARVDFYDVWSQLFVERFLEPIRKWCRDNGILSGGHFGGEDELAGNANYGYGHVMRALRGLDLPGVDVIWRQLFPRMAGGVKFFDEPANRLRTSAKAMNRPFAKYAASIARQAGHSLVLNETFGIYGSGLTPAQMKWLTDFQAVRGVTLTVIGSIMLSTRGPSMTGGRPMFGPINPLWDYCDIFHKYTARLSYLLSLGRAAHSNAFYFDVRSIWAGASRKKRAIAAHFLLSEQLLQQQCEFDYLDDDTLATARISSGNMAVGAMRYNTLLVPPTDFMAPDAKNNLKRFRAAGGRVLSEKHLQKMKPIAEISPANKDIRVTKRAIGANSLYFFTNEADKPIQLRLSMPEQGKPVLCDPMDGKFYSVSSACDSKGVTIDWFFEPFASALFLFGAKPDAARMGFQPNGRKITLAKGWKIQPIKQYKVGKQDYKIILINEKPKPITLGDWKQTLGKYFSGHARYAIQFKNPFVEDAILQLGKVAHACTIKLNGRILDRKIFLPYAADITGFLCKGMNNLEVIVTNTLANALADPEVPRQWLKNFNRLSVYENKQRAFEKDSLDGGLIGPVTIMFGKKIKTETAAPSDLPLIDIQPAFK